MRARIYLTVGVACMTAIGASATAEAGISSNYNADHPGFGKVLTVKGDKRANTIGVYCTDGRAKVNGSNPDDGPVQCAKVDVVNVISRGGRDFVDLTDVSPDEFASNPTLLSFAQTSLGSGDDTLAGSQMADNALGGQGDDEMRTFDGKDVLRGGGGADKLFGGDGGDGLYGEEGPDILVGGPGRDNLNGGPGEDITTQ